MVTTNIALLDIDDAEIDVGTFSPYDGERHDSLVSEFGDTHVIRRRADSLEAVRIDGTASPIGDTCERKRIRRLGGLLCVLLEDAIGRALLGGSAEIVCSKRRPLALVSRQPKNDLAHTLFGAKTHGRLPLHIRRSFTLEVRQLRGAGSSGRRYGLIIDARTATEVDVSCEELLADGVDLRGLYVQVATDPFDRLVERTRESVGIVARVDGKRVVLGADRGSDQVEYPASELYVDPGPSTVSRLLAHYVGPRAFDRLAAERKEIASGHARWERIARFHERLAAREIRVVDGVHARVRGWMTSDRLTTARLALPQFVVGGGRVVNATKDVFRSGPQHVPAKLGKTTRACVIFEKRQGDRVEAFLRQLRDGLLAHRGLANSWRISNLQWSLFAAADHTASAYEEACRAAFDKADDWDLALVQVPDASADNAGDANPYLVTKSKFLARGIPVQEFREETMQKPHEQLQWALGGISLQMFAKVGGTPWLLKSDDAAHEVVLGLGSAQLGTGRFGARERIVGLTTAFTGDGAYWLTESSRAVSYEDHEQAVGDTAIAAIARVREKMNWSPGDLVRLVFHSFKDFRGAHVAKIQEQVSALKSNGLRIETAFVHLVEKHPILLFDLEERHRIAPRGIYTVLGEHEALVSLLGPVEVRSERLGLPRPLQLKLHRDSSFTNMNYLCTQALALAAISWRNYAPTSLPVTILYADLIAGLLGRMGDLSRWDPDVLRGRAGEGRWFL